jgi:hypothetical protein
LQFKNITCFQCRHHHHHHIPPKIRLLMSRNFRIANFFENKLNNFSRAPPPPPMFLSRNESAVRRGGGRILMGDNASVGTALLPPIEFQCFGCEFKPDCLILTYITNHKYNKF